jgi:succinyl-diaminopimelate desuccinylase
VPDAVRLLVDRRLLPEEDAETVQSELTNLIGRAVVAVPGVVCKVRRSRLLPAVVRSDAVEPLVAALRDAVEGLGEPRPGIYGTAYETLAREFAAAGVPVVMFGTGRAASVGRMALGADESLELDNVRVATEALALALAKLLAPAAG